MQFRQFPLLPPGLAQLGPLAGEEPLGTVAVPLLHQGRQGGGKADARVPQQLGDIAFGHPQPGGQLPLL